MANNDTLKKTLTVTLVLSLVCSVLVSAAAVFLKDRQDQNKLLDVQGNILSIAGLVDDPRAMSRDEILAKFKEVKPMLVDLKSGDFYSGGDLNVSTYNDRAAAKDPKLSAALPAAADTALIKRREDVAKIYMVEENGKLKTLILPIRGYGLWSTLYGYMALDADLDTVVGLGFYEHGETPGLGGEVDNPRWKQTWKGKEIFNDNGKLDIAVIKGSVVPGPNAKHQVDGLSGATLTTRGVNNLVNFWLGNNGFGPFLANLKKGEA
ncbi:Na(+)-translocating NADH-quinone reductase subunit C [Endozoicomonadaceae bacterium StTr2]